MFDRTGAIARHAIGANEVSQNIDIGFAATPVEGDPGQPTEELAPLVQGEIGGMSDRALILEGCFPIGAQSAGRPVAAAAFAYAGTAAYRQASSAKCAIVAGSVERPLASKASKTAR